MDNLDKTTFFRSAQQSGSEEMGGAMITIFDGVSDPVQIDLAAFNKAVVTFGREQGNDIVIHSNYVSRRHGQFRFMNGSWVMEDLGSKNGILFNGVNVPRRVLCDNDVLRIDEQTENTSTGVLFVFSTSGDNMVWRTLPLQNKNEVIIGRDPSCDIQLNHVGVSRKHASIIRSGNGYQIIDTNSTNGVWVNGKKVSGRVTLREKDVIVITNSRIIFSAAQLNYCTFNKGIRVDASHIFKKVDGGKKTICNDVSMRINPCELVAIIGGSGAGKSTIMNCISGYSKPTSGQVIVNGSDLYSNYESIKDIVGYVPQQDIVFDNLTVYDMLKYTAQLRLPDDIKKKELDEIILKVIDTVELTQRKDTLIKRLSGGQKKRASIAVELISDPTLFFLDEPASGLDPGTERNLMRTLKGMAISGKTIIFVTHSTLNLHMCDKIVFMGAGGKLCFCGNYNEALKFFEVSDLVDVYNLITDNPDFWQNKYNSIRTDRVEGTTTASTVQKKVNKHGAVHQMAVLAKRSLHTLFNDKVRLLLLLVQAPLLALLISFVANGMQFKEQETTKSLLFALSCSSFWVGILNSIQEICKERVILRREYMTGLQLGPYILSKMFVMALICFIQSVLLTAVFVLRVGQAEYGLIFKPAVEMFIITFLTALAASAMGIFVSALFKNADRAMTVAPILLMPQLLFSGLIFKLSGITKAISWIVTCRFTMEGYGSAVDMNSMVTRQQNVLQNVDSIRGVPIAETTGYANAWELMNYTNPVDPAYASTVSHFASSILMLCVFVGAFTLLAWIAVRNIKKER